MATVKKTKQKLTDKEFVEKLKAKRLSMTLDDIFRLVFLVDELASTQKHSTICLMDEETNQITPVSHMLALCHASTKGKRELMKTVSEFETFLDR